MANNELSNFSNVIVETCFFLNHGLYVICKQKLFESFFASNHCFTVHRQAILPLVVESGTRKLKKVVESRTVFPFDEFPKSE